MVEDSGGLWRFLLHAWWDTAARLALAHMNVCFGGCGNVCSTLTSGGLQLPPHATTNAEGSKNKKKIK